MPETRHRRYTNATEAIMQGLSVDVHATIDAGHDLPAGSTVVLRTGDVITLIDQDPEPRYEHAWLEDLDDEQWAAAVDDRNDELAAEREALEQDEEEPVEPAQPVETVELPTDPPAPAKATPKKATKAAPKNVGVDPVAADADDTTSPEVAKPPAEDADPAPSPAE